MKYLVLGIILTIWVIMTEGDQTIPAFIGGWLIGEGVYELWLSKVVEKLFN